VDKGANDRNGGGAVAPAAVNEDLSGIGSPLASPSLGPRIAKMVDRLRSGIGFRLLAAVLLFSSLVTLTLTALQLYLDYDHEVGVIETRLDEIGRSMNGRELAEAVLERRPGVKVLYTSGYTDEFAHEGRLDSGVALLRKPYRKSDLSHKIREVLAAK
jgi:hypothetical protein